MSCVIYTRISSQEQAEGYSLDAQVSLLQAYAKNNEFQIIGTFREIESGKKSKRREFDRMVDFIRKNKVQTVLVEKTDRFSRNFRDADVIETLGIELHLVKENEIITPQSSSHTKLVFGFKTLLAKHFLDNLSEETRKGMYAKAEGGGYPALAPIGYINNPSDKTVEVDKKRARFIREAFELYATGSYSLVTLMEELNRRGLRTKKGKILSKRGMQTILRNPFYYGMFNWSGQLWKACHKAIISKQLFDRVQERLSQKNCSRNKGLWFAFKGILRCAQCGHAITAESHKGHTYYSCATSNKCGGYWREEKIDAIIAGALSKFHISEQTKESIKVALLESHEEEAEFSRTQLQILQGEFAQNDSWFHKLYEDRLKGIVDEDFFKIKYNSIKQRQHEIQADIERLKQKNQDYMEEALQILELMQSMRNQWDKADLEKKASIAKILILELKLSDVSCSIEWNKPFDLLYDVGKVKSGVRQAIKL